MSFFAGGFGNLLSLAGGLIGQHETKKQSEYNRALTQQQMAMQKRQFAAQMDQSIQRRVADASKAGIHPLFALGASVGTSPTASIGGGEPPTGSALGAAVQKIGERIAAAQIQANSSSAKRDEAEAGYFNAIAAKTRQDILSRGRDGANVQTFPYPGGPAGPDISYGPIEPIVPQVKYNQPGRPHVTAGRHPGMTELDIGDGVTVRIFSSEAQADELNQLIIAGGMQRKAFYRAAHSLGWEKDAKGVWRKVRKRDPWFRITNEETGKTWEW